MPWHCINSSSEWLCGNQSELSISWYEITQDTLFFVEKLFDDDIKDHQQQQGCQNYFWYSRQLRWVAVIRSVRVWTLIFDSLLNGVTWQIPNPSKIYDYGLVGTTQWSSQDLEAARSTSLGGIIFKDFLSRQMNLLLWMCAVFSLSASAYIWVHQLSRLIKNKQLIFVKNVNKQLMFFSGPGEKMLFVFFKRGLDGVQCPSPPSTLMHGALKRFGVQT